MKNLLSILGLLFFFTACNPLANHEEKIKESIHSILQNNEQYKNVRLEIHEDTVLLNGSVASMEAKTSLDQAVKAIDQIGEVINNIEITGGFAPLTQSIFDITKNYPTIEAQVTGDSILILRGEIKKQNWEALRKSLSAIPLKKMDTTRLILN